MSKMLALCAHLHIRDLAVRLQPGDDAAADDVFNSINNDVMMMASEIASLTLILNIVSFVV